MNAMRKYAVWIVGLGLAAFIIPSLFGSFEKFGKNTAPKTIRASFQNGWYGLGSE